MEQIVVKKEPKELVDDCKGDILMNYHKPSTSADHEMPSTSGVAIKQEIKEELEDDEDMGSKINRINEETDNSDGSENFLHLCNKCNFVAVRKIDLDNHLKTHNKKSYLKCHFCPFMAAGLQTLDVHISTNHELENKEKLKRKIISEIYRCRKCLYSTLYKSAYENHNKLCLKGVKCFKCEICHFKTLYRSSLNKHLKNHNKLE